MNPRDSWPVHEFVLPKEEAEGEVFDEEPDEGENENDNKKKKYKKIAVPDFLSSRANTNRVVEFYAPWCPHCRHFKKKFVAFARNMTGLMGRLGSEIEFHAISCTVHKPLCRHHGVRSYPSVKVFHPGDVNGTVVEYWNLHPFAVLRELRVEADDVSDVRIDWTDRGSGSSAKADGEDSRKETVMSKNDLFYDAYLSFHFAMKNSVFMTTDALGKSAADSLHEWLRLLSQALPPTWKIQRSISAILENFEEAAQSEDALLKLIEPHPPPTKEWSPSCTKGDPHAGYTCGLWEMFHIMTIGVYEWNSLADEGSQIPANHAADTLHDYISNFFACDVCRQNFLNAYDSCAHNRCTRLGSSTSDANEWKQLALWLWETHNAVNVRLMKERAEQNKQITTSDDEVRAQWPSRKDCRKCWNDDGTWEDDVIFKYLRIHYWPDDSIATAHRKDLGLDEPGIEMAIVRMDDDDPNSYMPYFLPLVPISILVIVWVAWYFQKVEKDKTGRHKKTDES